MDCDRLRGVQAGRVLFLINVIRAICLFSFCLWVCFEVVFIVVLWAFSVLVES